MKKTIFFTIFFVLTVTAVSSYILTSLRSEVYISKAKLEEFSTAAPLTSEICKQNHSLEYYIYKNEGDFEKRNNKFGLYIYPDNEKFIEMADRLVNSNGGDWGYVLIPYNVQETHKDKWDRVFYLLQDKHLIPVVQLWNIDPEKFKEETEEAVKFLDSLVWPIRIRYVSVYNEPNDAAFWYGKVDPAEYARILDYTIETFKETNEDFFMLNGALNVSAADTPTSMDAFDYMLLMDKEVPGIFEKLDGWASHSYPQPNFSGNPYATGRNSIKAYDTELKFLKDNFGVADLPVFITETGWAHDVGKSFNNTYLSVPKIAENFRIAFEEVWLPDERVRAVMPFTIWYDTPFDHFSWVDERMMPYEHYQIVKSLPKIEGEPPYIELSSIGTLGCEENL